jgi:hypothetical protein
MTPNSEMDAETGCYAEIPLESWNLGNPGESYGGRTSWRMDRCSACPKEVRASGILLICRGVQKMRLLELIH